MCISENCDNFLSMGLNHPRQLVQVRSLRGLSSASMHPKKVRGDRVLQEDTHFYPRKWGGGGAGNSLHCRHRIGRNGWGRQPLQHRTGLGSPESLS